MAQGKDDPEAEGTGGAKPPVGRVTEAERREARLKDALKANMARRKAQARARAGAAARAADQPDAADAETGGR